MMVKNQAQGSGGVLRPAQAAAHLGISKATLYRWAAEMPDFPKPLHLGKRSSGWRLADLESWIGIRAAQSNGADHE